MKHWHLACLLSIVVGFGFFVSLAVRDLLRDSGEEENAPAPGTPNPAETATQEENRQLARLLNEAGDHIIKVDGKPTANMRLREAVELIQGKPGTPVTLTVVHEGAKEPVDLTVTRARIEVPSLLGDRRQPDDLGKWDFLIDKRDGI